MTGAPEACVGAALAADSAAVVGLARAVVARFALAIGRAGQRVGLGAGVVVAVGVLRTTR